MGLLPICPSERVNSGGGAIPGGGLTHDEEKDFLFLGVPFEEKFTRRKGGRERGEFMENPFGAVLHKGLMSEKERIITGGEGRRGRPEKEVDGEI